MRKTMILLALLLSFGAKAQKTQPNVLVIYTDDHRYSGVHILGKQVVKTPHIDDLAQNGVAFTNAYLMGSFLGATCVASRAMLHTGRNLFQLKTQGRTLPIEQTTMGEAFQKAGYHSHIVGKWHQDNSSLSRSFNSGATIMGRSAYLTDHFRMPLWDWNKGGNYTRKEAYLLVYDEKGKVKRRPLLKTDKRGPTGTEKNGPHTSEIFADNASKFLTSYDKKKPFFMYLAFHAPHDPRQAPKKYLKMYPAKKIELLPSYMPQHPFDNGHIVLRDEELAAWPRTPEIARKQLADYYAIITHLDVQIGRVIKALKASGQYENTLIVLAGDSGLGVGNHGLLGKQNIYDEDGIHVPFILSGGAIKEKGRRSDALCYIHDIFPTVCDLAGIDKPASASGKSLQPILSNQKKQVRTHTYHAYRQHQRAYREGNYKLIEYVRAPDFHKKKGEFYAGSRVTQLFDVKNDPWETLNLSIFPKYDELIEKMQTSMKKEAEKIGDYKEGVAYSYDFWDYYTK